ncbi:RNA polymerase sigma-70 factor, ECF subfamily [Mucilaginibacter mallensis]|uniref:RNA polymerase sigma-70 factor, ECF subfamily n=1 Tax=Mucilaginibacter mallensis TaxID=652787 RepID=A0A1H1W7D2_MUCMA|nr:sigma-70 family RNA polymerase sigma factor [Mucilaginibacter mallensis]SDS92079.1 RNA polymerase sigma-70 factor, ECF subfamily [Mucilaginibacter mallensis]
MEEFSESELVALLQNDNVKAFDLLYKKYHAPVYNNILKLLKDADESENILQDLFVTLWEKRASIDPQKPVANWLFQVSYNKSITQLKKKLKQSLAFKCIEGDMMLVDEKDIYFKEAKLKILEEALVKLSPQKRKVFDLCKLQGKSYEECAHELNISKHTVKEYLSAAVKAVKEYAEQHPVNDLVFIYIIVALKIIR